jgi:hypothetical protein
MGIGVAPEHRSDAGAVHDYAAPSFGPRPPLIEVLGDFTNRTHSDSTYR